MRVAETGAVDIVRCEAGKKQQQGDNKALQLKHSSANAPFQHDRSRAFRSQPFHVPSLPTCTFLSASTVECSALGNKKAIVATKICVGRKQGER